MTTPKPEDLTSLLRLLEARGYDFVTVTPETHARVLEKRGPYARSLRDVFGWNLPFAPQVVGDEVFGLLRHGGLCVAAGALWKSNVRVAKLAGHLFVHSHYPTDEPDAIFFGPDSYRFADFIRRELPQGEGLRIIDLGCGGGVGGIVAALLRPDAQVVLTDINRRALTAARANAEAAGVSVDIRLSRDLEGLGPADVIMANPPYMVDAGARTYRDGGGASGEAVALRWARSALDCLTPGGRLLLYTGVAIRDGRDVVREGLEALDGADLHYGEIDPDVFGEEVSNPLYGDAERIAVVGAVLVKR